MASLRNSTLSTIERSDRYRQAIEAVRDYAVYLMDPEGTIVDWNRGAELMKGYSADEAIGQNFSMLYPQGDQARDHPADNLRAAARLGTFQEEGWRLRKNGELFWAHIEIISLYDASGVLFGYCKLTQDLTERKRLEDQVRDAQQETERILESAHAATWQWDSASDTVSVSPTLLGALGYEPEEIPNTGAAWAELVHPDDLGELSRDLAPSQDDDSIQTSKEFRLRTKNGRYRWFLTRLSQRGGVARANGSSVVTGITVDIHEQKIAEQQRAEAVSQLRFEKERALVTLGSIGDAVISTDKSGRIIEFNATAARLTGWPLEEASGRFIGDILDIYDEDSREPLGDFISSCLETGRTTDMSPRALLRSRQGESFSIEDVASPIRTPDGEIRGLVIVFRDVTESRRLVRALAHQATHDPLTGLVNRAEFESRTKRALDSAERSETESALLYMDLDQFKIVNDTCGHKAGDELLRQLAQHFRAHVRERDTLARLGGDEFALLIEHCTLNEALRVANKVLETTRAFQFPFNDRIFRVGVSIGLVPITAASQSLQLVMQRADHACYTAKEAGRNRVHIQHEGDEQLARRQSDMDWASRIGEALHDHAFQLFYQTIAPVGKGGGLHYEILLRMNDGIKGWILPGNFLPAAERYDMMPAVDRWVLEHTLMWLEKHSQHVAQLDLCTINLSARTLDDERFQESAISLLHDTSVPTDKLCFEITETAAIGHLTRTIAFIEKLKATGCRFALDDFGTGMASFSYLKNLPVDFIKIDGSFVVAMLNSAADAEMVRSVNQIGHLMGKKTVAEWVTDEKTMDLLSDFGVDFVQGFWISEPQPLLE